MFHDLLTIQGSFEQFTHFNGLLQGFLTKILFLCTRETLCKPNTIDACIGLLRRRQCYPNIVQAECCESSLSKLRRSRCSSNTVQAEYNRCLHQIVEAQPMLSNHRASRMPRKFTFKQLRRRRCYLTIVQAES